MIYPHFLGFSLFPSPIIRCLGDWFQSTTRLRFSPPPRFLPSLHLPMAMSGAEEPTNKRKRSEHEPHPNVIIVRSELWLKDGNVILQAENMQFKVYRGILSLNSTVFSDMFSTPQPPSGQELIEGCPIVHLSDTSADVTIMLEAICQRRYALTCFASLTHLVTPASRWFLLQICGQRGCSAIYCRCGVSSLG